MIILWTFAESCDLRYSANPPSFFPEKCSLRVLNSTSFYCHRTCAFTRLFRLAATVQTGRTPRQHTRARRQAQRKRPSGLGGPTGQFHEQGNEREVERTRRALFLRSFIFVCPFPFRVSPPLAAAACRERSRLDFLNFSMARWPSFALFWLAACACETDKHFSTFRTYCVLVVLKLLSSSSLVYTSDCVEHTCRATSIVVQIFHLETPDTKLGRFAQHYSYTW